ncbi:cytoplasmic aconitate hydratase-like [Lineus longissimus]|uniref:cytoplasmic aconitate hydratase-like n=1 Tax=Lineus longissimus TaxID=88925 RepID=UPI00315DB6AB
MLNIRAVIAESYERIHRSNLVGMGIMLLQYLEGETVETHGLTGKEQFSITLPDKLKPTPDIRSQGERWTELQRFRSIRHRSGTGILQERWHS